MFHEVKVEVAGRMEHEEDEACTIQQLTSDIGGPLVQVEGWMDVLIHPMIGYNRV